MREPGSMPSTLILYLSPRCPSETASAMFLMILLVILLGLPEGCGRDDHGHDPPPRAAGALQPFQRLFRQAALFLGVVKDGRAVLVADIRALAVELGRVVAVPKDIQQLSEGD